MPAFYERDENGTPAKWIEKMRNSMAVLTPQFSANRTVREYTEKYYLPAAEKYLQRAAEKGAAGVRIINAEHELKSKWNEVHVNDVKMENIENGFACSANIFLNEIDSDKVLVQLYADGKDGDKAEHIALQLQSSSDGEELYTADVNTTRPAGEYRIRIIPNYENISVPLENNCILWQR